MLLHPPGGSFFPRWSSFPLLARTLLIEASQVAQRLRIHRLMQETLVQFLGRDDPAEKEMATHISSLAWEIPWTEVPRGYSSWGREE